jgi:hypothetical protein
MKPFNVVVEKVMCCKGIVKMKANSEQEAKDKVMKGIRSGRIKPYQVAWGDLNTSARYHDGSFQTTGDVE